MIEKRPAFATFFKERRMKTGHTLREFCLRHSFDPGNLSRIERGLMPPPRARKKLEVYAGALKIPRASEDWGRFFDLASAAAGVIPEDIMSDETIVEQLPQVFRTLRRKGQARAVQEAKSALKPVLERLVKKMSPEEIWLFGSRAEGRAHAGSDWDLLVVMPDGTDPGLLDPVAAWELLRGLNVPVDVVPCTRSEFEEEKLEVDTLPQAAWTRGARLYVRPS